MKASVNALKTPSADTSPAAGFRSDLPGDLRGRSVEEGGGGCSYDANLRLGEV